MDATYFDTIGPYHQLGVTPAAGPPAAETGGAPNLANSSLPGLFSDAGPLSPENPLFWFGLVLAATLGLVAVSANARVANVRVGGSVGKT